MLKELRHRLAKNDYMFIAYHTLISREYRKYCADIGRNARMFRFEHLGEENPGKNIYFIREGTSAQGMFSIVTWTLRRLEVADRFHFTPVVTWATDVPVGISGHPNPFLIYFQPVSDISVESAMKSTDIAFANSYDRAYGSSADSYDFSRGEIKRLARIYQKYLKLKPDLQEKINCEIAELLRKKPGRVLGVHVRGVDWRKTKIYRHPVTFTEEDYLNEAKEMMRTLKYEKVFLASDSEGTIEMFRAEFGDRLITTQAMRTPVGENSLVIFNNKNDPYQLAYEVLRDAYALASCDSLLCGLSYVSYAAQIIRFGESTPYEKVVVLDKGKVEKGLSLKEAERRERDAFLDRNA